MFQPGGYSDIIKNTSPRVELVKSSISENNIRLSVYRSVYIDNE